MLVREIINNGKHPNQRSGINIVECDDSTTK